MDCEHWTIMRGTDHLWRCEECELEFTPRNQPQTGPPRPAWPTGALRRE